MIRLNMGAGKLPIKGYVNIDIRQTRGIDVVHDVCKMKELYQTASVDEIMAVDIVEHLGRNYWKQVVQDWVDLLKPGGVLKIRVPDLEKMIDWFNTNWKPGDRNIFERFVQLAYADQDFPENTHNVGFAKDFLVEDLKAMGMRIDKFWYDGGIQLRITAIKGEEEPLVTLDHLDYLKENYK